MARNYVEAAIQMAKGTVGSDFAATVTAWVQQGKNYAPQEVSAAAYESDVKIYHKGDTTYWQDVVNEYAAADGIGAQGDLGLIWERDLRHQGQIVSFLDIYREAENAIHAAYMWQVASTFAPLECKAQIASVLAFSIPDLPEDDEDPWGVGVSLPDDDEEGGEYEDWREDEEDDDDWDDEDGDDNPFKWIVAPEPEDWDNESEDDWDDDEEDLATLDEQAQGWVQAARADFASFRESSKPHDLPY